MSRGERQVASYHRDDEHRLWSHVSLRLVQALLLTKLATLGNFCYLSELPFS